MKKYLMMGLAALALASCTKDEIQFVDSDIAKYETAFVNTFGQPSPTQTWGFGTTRGITRSAYPNANQWASQGYTVPDPLKPGQKARVQFFFQTKKNPGGTQDYGQIDFFVQQVYDGATDPITNYEGYSSTDYSTERYLAADLFNYIESGAHMDHLTAGSDNEHIYNFNNGTCSTNKNVGDNGAALDTDQHADEIMLMQNTKTDKFGYANSDASYVRTDRYNLVSGAVIDQYIKDNKAAYDAWLAQHEGITDAIVDDDWHRSFIGFDFDQLPDKNVFINYSETRNEKGEVTSVSMDYATWTGPGYDRFYWDGEKMVETHTVNEKDWSWNAKEGYEVMTWKGKKVPMVSENKNQYCGDKKSFANDDDIMIEKEDATYGKHKCLNMEVLGPLIDQGYLPCSSTLKDWVKVGGCDDGYYSDWIVSFLPATPTDPKEPGEPEETVYDLRVMAEDLTIVGDVAKTDFDFNDVVFDAVLLKNEDNVVTGAKIRLLAAGGTLPLRIGGEANNQEVHDLFEVSTNTMVNTINDGTATYKTRVKPVEFEISGNWASIKDIPVEVQKNGVWKLITAEQGQPASKFGCPVGTDWCDEWEHIDNKWSGKFTDWVNDETKPFWEDLKVNW